MGPNRDQAALYFNKDADAERDVEGRRFDRLAMVFVDHRARPGVKSEPMQPDE